MTDKKAQLQLHKRIATGLFLLMAGIYLGMVYALKHNPASWMGYVKAFSEAAMVGALADWFAVTALFKHPMGIKIPHTNLIENKKNDIGDNLGSFVTDNFLTPATIRPYIDKLQLAHFLSTWLNQPKNQLLLERELIFLLQSIVKDLDEKRIIDFLTQKAQQGIDQINTQQLLAQGIHYAVEQNEHNRLITLVLPKIQVYIDNHREEIYNQIVEKKPLLGLVGGKTVTNQLIKGLHAFLEDIQTNEQHKVREEVTLQLTQLIQEIATSPTWKAKLHDLLHQFVTAEVIHQYLTDFWQTSKKTLLDQLQEENSTLRIYIKNSIQSLGQQLEQDTDLQERLNQWTQVTLYRLALRNTQEVSTLIRNTVDQWDGRELSDKLELEVGKDLQFIRINGTLVGLLIYCLTQFL
ncbi:DUF445 family protein [Myroides sp. 1354]|uniref:DUF445 domain-containing protein n=1 Tax=unclassified Myroides TaxID=2642485 RepID=UPI0025749C1E|nr:MULTISPECIES: DUF445 family protein [unclassified Myroides]MDM1045272.1 DUF445 family protein [Myroides sp. R163-1]MDM1056154.1 DUF445 family protein [Myroides sp. 1354]MDM1069283.1 DUF445 family protein [Myroides sp. 1372]